MPEKRTMYAVVLYNGTHFMGYMPNSMTYDVNNAKKNLERYNADPQRIFVAAIDKIPDGFEHMFLNHVIDGTSEERIVILHFQNDAEKSKFMGGLSDGFGENDCQLTWGDGLKFDDAIHFHVENLDPYNWDEEEE
jgi:hypothetical protein